MPSLFRRAPGFDWRRAGSFSLILHLGLLVGWAMVPHTALRIPLPDSLDIIDVVTLPVDELPAPDSLPLVSPPPLADQPPTPDIQPPPEPMPAPVPAAPPPEPQPAPPPEPLSAEPPAPPAPEPPAPEPPAPEPAPVAPAPPEPAPPAPTPAPAPAEPAPTVPQPPSPVAPSVPAPPSAAVPEPEPIPEPEPPPEAPRLSPRVSTAPRLTPPRRVGSDPSATGTGADSGDDTDPAGRLSPPGQASAISWQERVLNQIDHLKLTIPFDAVRNRPGVAIVQVTIDRKGNVIDATLDKGSGNAQIDLASLKLIKTASPFPEPPLSIDGRLITLKIEVDFTTLPTTQ